MNLCQVHNVAPDCRFPIAAQLRSGHPLAAAAARCGTINNGWLFFVCAAVAHFSQVHRASSSSAQLAPQISSSSMALRAGVLRRAVSLGAPRFAALFSALRTGHCQTVTEIQRNGHVQRQRLFQLQRPNHSLNRTLHSMPSFSPPFHSGLNAVLLFRAG